MIPSHGRISSSKNPKTPVAGCRRRFRPIAGFERPDRRSSAGVWIDPQAATTARERTVTRWPSSVSASTPCAAPPATSTRRACVRTRMRAPAACASASHVFTVDCFAPCRQPNPHQPHSRGSQPSTSRGIRSQCQPSRSSPRREDLLAARDLVVVGVHAEPLAHRVEAAGERLAREGPVPPLRAHLVRRPERGRVVDDRRAAEQRPASRPTDWSCVAVAPPWS